MYIENRMAIVSIEVGWRGGVVVIADVGFTIQLLGDWFWFGVPCGECCGIGWLMSARNTRIIRNTLRGFDCQSL